MKIEKHDGSVERKILIALIVDSIVLGRVASRWEKEGLFDSKWSNIVAGWCVDYYRRYEKAPKRSIEALFASWATDNNDKETTRLVESFLGGLSGEYVHFAKESNSDFIIDLAGKYFNKVKISKLTEILQGDLEGGDAEKAHKRIVSFNRVEMGINSGIDIFSDEEAMIKTFASKGEPLVTYPEALGMFFQDALERDGLVAFQAPEKTGKTFWLLDVAWRAVQQGRKVAFFAVGDMSQNQMMLRFMERAARHPFKSPDGKWPYTVKVPNYIEPGGGDGSVTYEEVEFEKPINLSLARKEFHRVVIRVKKKYPHLKKDEPLLKLSTHPNSSINVAGIVSMLQAWELTEWVPDVVVIDYADILAPPAGVAETRDQINATWKQLRALSQSLHCLVVTATQSNAASYKEEIQTRSNFSEDKRKLSHVTGLVGLNQNHLEKLQGIMRLNWIALREGEFSPMKCCHVAGCLAIANPAMKSVF